MFSLARGSLSRCIRTPVISTPMANMSTFNRPNALTAYRQQLTGTSLFTQTLTPSTNSILNGPIGSQQCRWKSLGNFYQPSTTRRKRKFGFLARLRCRGGRKILLRRRLKNRWYLSH